MLSRRQYLMLRVGAAFWLQNITTPIPFTVQQAVQRSNAHLTFQTSLSLVNPSALNLPITVVVSRQCPHSSQTRRFYRLL